MHSIRAFLSGGPAAGTVIVLPGRPSRYWVETFDMQHQQILRWMYEKETDDEENPRAVYYCRGVTRAESI